MICRNGCQNVPRRGRKFFVCSQWRKFGGHASQRRIFLLLTDAQFLPSYMLLPLILLLLFKLDNSAKVTGGEWKIILTNKINFQHTYFFFFWKNARLWSVIPLHWWLACQNLSEILYFISKFFWKIFLKKLIKNIQKYILKKRKFVPFLSFYSTESLLVSDLEVRRKKRAGYRY